MHLLGIDNVFFEVNNLNEALIFYQKLEFKLKFSIPRIRAALFSIGMEEPGLLIFEKETISPSKLWIEIKDAREAQKECASLGSFGKMIETATGFTYEVTDSSGNIIGFADYRKKSELARPIQ